MKTKSSFSKRNKKTFSKTASLILTVVMVCSVFSSCAVFKNKKPISDSVRQTSKQFLSQIVVPDIFSIIDNQNVNQNLRINNNKNLNYTDNAPLRLSSAVNIAADENMHKIEDFEKAYDDIFPLLEDTQLNGEYFALQIKFLLAEVLPEMPVTGQWVLLSEVLLEDQEGTRMPPRYAKLDKTDDSIIFMSYEYNYIEHDYPGYDFTYVSVTDNGGETTMQMQSYSRRYLEEIEYTYRLLEGSGEGVERREKVENLYYIREQSIKYTKGKLYSNYSSEYTQRADNSDILERRLSICDFQRPSDKIDMVYGYSLSHQFNFNEYKNEHLMPPSVFSYFGNEKLGYITGKPEHLLTNQQQETLLYKDGYLLFAPERVVINPFKQVLYRVNKNVDHSPPSTEFWEEYLKDFTPKYDDNGNIIDYLDADDTSIGYDATEGIPKYYEDYFDSDGMPLYYNLDGKPIIRDTGNNDILYDVSGRMLYYITNYDTWEIATSVYDKMYFFMGIEKSITGTAVLLPVANLQELGYTDITYTNSDYNVFEDDAHITPKKYNTDSYNIKTYAEFYSNIDFIQMVTTGWAEFTALNGYTSTVYEFIEGKWETSDFNLLPENIEHTYPLDNSFKSYYSPDYPGLFLPVNLTDSESVSKFIVEEYQESANFYLEYRDTFESKFSLLQICPDYASKTTVAQQLNFLENHYYNSMVSAAERDANLLDKVALVNRNTYEDTPDPIIGSTHFQIHSMLYNGSIVIMDAKMTETDIERAKLDSGTFRRVYGLFDAEKDMFYEMPFADKGNKNSTFGFSGYQKYNTACLEIDLEEFASTIEALADGTYFSVTRIEKLNTETAEWEPYSVFNIVIFTPQDFYLTVLTPKNSNNIIIMEQAFATRSDGGRDALNAFKIKTYNIAP